jgi:hypothetical protein
MNIMKAYTLKKKKDTEEYHLFEGNLLEIKKCDTNLVKESICKMMSIDENEGNVFTCENEDLARLRIAKIGKQVCGVCTSHLYENYKK